jgi:hypothetical protein
MPLARGHEARIFHVSVIRYEDYRWPPTFESRAGVAMPQ